MIVTRSISQPDGHTLSSEQLSSADTITAVRADLAIVDHNGITASNGELCLWVHLDGQQLVIRYSGSDQVNKILLRAAQYVQQTTYTERFLLALLGQPKSDLLVRDPHRGPWILACNIPTWSQSLDRLLAIPLDDFFALIALDIECPGAYREFTN